MGSVLDGVVRLRQVAGECAAAPAWPLSDREVMDCLAAAHAAQQQATAAVAHLVRQAQVRDLPAKHGATSAAVWLRDRLHLSPTAAHRLVQFGEALDKRPVLDAAVSQGAVSAEQATVIAAV